VTVNAVSNDCNAAFEWSQTPGTLIIVFDNNSTSEHDIISYSWNFGDGHNGDVVNPSHTYDEPGTYLVCLIITDNVGCVSDVCHEITVAAAEPDCHAGFTWDQVGNTLEVDFSNTSTSENDIISYSWNFGDGSTGDGANPSHTYDEPGTYVVCLIIHDSEGCVSDVCHEVHVEGADEPCHADFTWEQIPGTLQIHYHITSTSNHDIISYSWNFGDGQEGDGQNPYHTYEEPGTYVVCLVIHDSEGCVSDVCHEVHVEGGESECHADFTSEQIPGTLQIHYHSTSTSNHDIISYSWNFGDGQEGDGQNPYHTYDEPGTYVVCLVIHDSEGCVSDVCHEVHVEGGESECHAAFEWEQLEDSLAIHFINHATSNHDIISYQWNFGDGHTGDGPNPYHTYDEPGVYVVCLRIEDNVGCVSEICHEVHVEGEGSPCHAGFNWDQIDSSLVVQFINTSTSEQDIISYQWTFGDGHSSDGANPTHTYDHAGTYVVCLRIEDNTGCVSEICHEIHIEGSGEPCHAQFTWEQIPGTLQIHFHSTSTSEHDIVSYQWNFGDGHNGDGQNPYHTYDEPGTYLVCLIITDAAGCVSDVCHEVAVGQPECNATFNFEIDDEGVVHFNNNSTGTTPHTDWLWDFGDGETSDAENPEHEYPEPGIYTVCLYISDTTIDCVDTFCLMMAYQMGYEDLHNDEAIIQLQTTASNSQGFKDAIIALRYTNPATDQLIIDFNLDHPSTARFELHDMTGYRMISNITGILSVGKQQHTIDISQLHSGLYSLTITTGTERKTMCLTIAR
jgi:PKD repeat protein